MLLFILQPVEPRWLNIAPWSHNWLLLGGDWGVGLLVKWPIPREWLGERLVQWLGQLSVLPFSPISAAVRSHTLGSISLCIFWTRFQVCLQQTSVFLIRLSKKVNIIVTVEWTTKAFEKKKNPEKKFRLGWESNPDLYIGWTQCSIYWANQASWRANRCDRVAMVREKSSKNENFSR